jgi:hypothetical protein
MKDWRIDLVESLRGQKLVYSKYRQPRPEWDHDHCLGCGATFSELDGPDYLHEGYTTGPKYSHGSEYEWICAQCFGDLKQEMGWTVGYAGPKPN